MGAVGLEKSSAFQTASPELLDRLVERAVDGLERWTMVEGSTGRGCTREAAALAFLSVGVLAFLLLGPAHLRYGMTALVVPTKDAAEVSPYSISVQPGDVTVAKGADQVITAELGGFDSDEVFVYSPELPRRIRTSASPCSPPTAPGSTFSF